MASPQKRTYFPTTRDATELLGKLIRLGRRGRKMTEQDLAGRAGISRRTLQEIERGDLKCEIGLVFEDANIVGVKLFPESVTPESRSARNAGVGRRRAGTYLLRRMPSVEQSIIPEKPLR